MKKFEFTLQKVYQMKEDEQKVLKQALQSIDKRIVQLEVQLATLEKDVKRERLKLDQECQRGTTAIVLMGFSNYFKQASEDKKSLERQLEMLMRQKQQKQQQIIKNMNEIKLLDEKRNEQKAAYQAEVRSAENKEIDAFLSYNIAAQ